MPCVKSIPKVPGRWVSNEAVQPGCSRWTRRLRSGANSVRALFVADPSPHPAPGRGQLLTDVV